ncbi:MAG: LicD family protein [Lachnospiraceae bacterium]|nr:LicD family protein [Lachnospiraceae bacterium]
MRFDESFFKGEERDGFYIESEMKRAWAAELEVLMEIDRICKKHSIRYFADSGTLLGAVRHNGFIPWDDDLDIAMLRSDYMKFIRVAQAELKLPALCLDIYHQKHWSEPFARVVNGAAGIQLTKAHLERYHGCPYSVGVDIFILDDVPSTEAEYDATIELYEWTAAVKELFQKKVEQLESIEDSSEKEEIAREWEEQLEEQLVQLEMECNIKIDRDKNIPNQLLRVIDGLFAMYNGDGKDEVVNFPFMKKGNYHHCGKKKEWYRDSILLPFENITIPVPIDFYKVLEKSYGPNYLTPVKKWNFHDYPFYKVHKKKLKETQKDMRNIKGKMDRLEKLLSGN